MAKLLWRGGKVSPCVWLGIWAVDLHGWRKVAILPTARREGGRERGVGRARARERSSARGRKTRREKQAGHVYEKKSDRFNAVAAVRCLLIVEFKQFHSWLSYFWGLLLMDLVICCSRSTTVVVVGDGFAKFSTAFAWFPLFWLRLSSYVLLLLFSR